jgi:TFIIF-interacting CTD phosphatase-like protein
VTQEYLEASNVIPQFLGTPQNILVVIDLNGTLLFRPSRTAPKKFLTRPHAQLFLKYCVETFTVVIWSSARPENVKAMCDSILTPTLRGKVAAIWGRDKFNLTQQDYNLRVQCYKRLQKVWGDPRIAVSHPDYNFGGRWDQTNTVLIDDSIEKARSEPHNLIEVPEWFGNLDEADDILPQVHDHLNYLSLHSNVSACLRTNPFKPRTGGTQTLQ